MIQTLKKIFSIHLSFICLFVLLTSTNKICAQNYSNQFFSNQELLSVVFEKLQNLETKHQGKVNIVHIGDSHIQGDYFTNTIRQTLQDKFGNGGYGFSFPYSLLGTNGSRNVKYISNAKWESLLNIYPISNVGIGLSGIALYTSEPKFVVQLAVEDKYAFTNIKILYPSKVPPFNISVLDEPLEVLSTGTVGVQGTTFKYHQVKKGETVFSIARRYGTTGAKLKSANGMKSNNLVAGKKIKIPTKQAKRSKARISKIKVDDEFDCVTLDNKLYYSSYTSDTLMTRVAILPKDQHGMYNLNGFVLENNKPGVIYHSIGVNGSKISDYNKYPLFFDQLSILKPDLIILSFGTNESFGKLSAENYLTNLKQIIDNIYRTNKQAVVLVMTPPPSLFRRNNPNPYISDYTLALLGLSNLPIWDLYSRMGGSLGLKGEYSDLISRDNIHYTVKGYEVQGNMFLSDFLNAYNNYKKRNQNAIHN